MAKIPYLPSSINSIYDFYNTKISSSSIFDKNVTIYTIALFSGSNKSDG